MIELVAGIVGAVMIYIIGRFLLPEPQTTQPIVPEPWVLDYQKYAMQDQKVSDENE